MNIALITLDSLRYDVAVSTHMPNLSKILNQTPETFWRLVYAQGTYTLPSHKAMLHHGNLPNNPYSREPLYNRKIQSFFKVNKEIEVDIKSLYPLPNESSNVVNGFKRLGYDTLGIGGVGWFNTTLPTTSFWKDYYFDKFFWDKSFHELDFNSMSNQIDLMEKEIDKNSSKPLFFFLNVASTHAPFMGKGRSRAGQSGCLSYVDTQIPRMLKALPKPCHVILTADHGECFSEDGIIGHAFYHPKVMEVPMTHFIYE